MIVIPTPLSIPSIFPAKLYAIGTIEDAPIPNNAKPIIAIIGFALLGIGASSIVPIAYSLAGKIEGIDSGVGITIISIAVYGTFIGAPASLGFIANNYGINNIFVPMLIIFMILIIPLSFYRKKFSV